MTKVGPKPICLANTVLLLFVNKRMLRVLKQKKNRT